MLHDFVISFSSLGRQRLFSRCSFSHQVVDLFTKYCNVTNACTYTKKKARLWLTDFDLLPLKLFLLVTTLHGKSESPSTISEQICTLLSIAWHAGIKSSFMLQNLVWSKKLWRKQTFLTLACYKFYLFHQQTNYDIYFFYLLPGF